MIPLKKTPAVINQPKAVLSLPIQNNLVKGSFDQKSVGSSQNQPLTSRTVIDSAVVETARKEETSYESANEIQEENSTQERSVFQQA